VLEEMHLQHLTVSVLTMYNNSRVIAGALKKISIWDGLDTTTESMSGRRCDQTHGTAEKVVEITSEARNQCRGIWRNGMFRVL